LTGGRDLFQARLGRGTDKVDGPKFFCGSGNGHATLWSKRLQRSDGRQHDWDLELVTEKGGRGIDSGHVDEDARPKGQAIQPETVAPHRCLGLSAAREVIPDILAEIAAGLYDNLLVADKIESHFCLLFFGRK
jgi:hypothetical protein